MKKTAHIFLINSGFQLVSASLISKHTENNIFVCFEETIFESSKKNNTADHLLLDIKKLPFLGKRLSIRRNLNTVFQKIQTYRPSKVVVYMPSLAGARYNYFVHEGHKRYSDNISFNIIPDGAINLSTLPLSASKKKRVAKRPRSFLDKLFGLKYTPFSEDKEGVLSNAIDKIYVLKGLPHKYPLDKAINLPSMPTNIKSGSTSRKVLIIGENLERARIMTREAISKAEELIEEYLSKNNYSDISYIAHPAARTHKNYELMTKNSKIIEINGPIEFELMKHHYDVVIAVSSTALISAKMIYDVSAEVISFDSDKMTNKFIPMSKQLDISFDNLGIKKIRS